MSMSDSQLDDYLDFFGYDRDEFETREEAEACAEEELADYVFGD